MHKKFVASYSGGKDSVLAIHRALQMGHTPAVLLITYNTDKNRSWFHGIPEPVLHSVAESIGVPIWIIKTPGDLYTQNFEETLTRAKAELGVEMCVFGDIDIPGHREWGTERCQAAGIEPCFPLWGESRSDLVYEFIDNGFTANITVVDTRRMRVDFLGQQLTRETVDRIAAEGADICGENGEYHTFVSAGPIFNQPVRFAFGDKLMENEYAIQPIMAGE